MHYPIDPFALKSLPKRHIRRAAWTIYARIQEKIADLSFASRAIPIRQLNLSAYPDPEMEQTAVTGLQLSYLIAALKATESLLSTVVVEVGSYRGATTLALALETRRIIFAIDPYIGYGGAEEDRETFQKRIGNLPNAIHLRLTSGAAARTWSHGKVGFVFIDALHDYVNTSYDIEVWGQKLIAGGLMALHDTDNPRFSGTRKAAFAAPKTMDLWAHVNDLVILKKRE